MSPTGPNGPEQPEYGNRPIRTDLSGNPLPDQAPPNQPYAPNVPQQPYGQPPYGAPPPYGAGQAPPPYGQAVWPPPAAGQPYPGMQQNTSGTRTVTPPEIAMLRWNWGAFLLPVFWAFANRATPFNWILLATIPLAFFISFVTAPVDLGIRIYLGIKGHQIAWLNRRFEGGVPEFFEVQRAWLKWGVGFFIASLLVIPILAAILFPVFMAARQKAMQQNGTYIQTQPTTGGTSGSSSGQ
jgi:hypothetical protein